LGEGLKHPTRSKQLGQHDGLGLARGVDEIERNGGAVPARELGGDLGILVGPVAAQQHKVLFLQFSQDFLAVKDRGLLVWQVAHQRAVKST